MTDFPFLTPDLSSGATPDHHVLPRLFAAVVLSTIAASVYYFIQKRQLKTISNLPYTMILFCVIVCGMMIVIGNSVAKAFGLGGALSLLRFRLNIKNPMDMAAILFSMTIGIACGAATPLMATYFTVFILTIFLAVNLSQTFRYQLRKSFRIHAASSYMTNCFLDHIVKNFSVEYVVSTADSLGKSEVSWVVMVVFKNEADIQKLKSWIQSDKRIMFSEKAHEVTLDVTQWVPEGYVAPSPAQNLTEPLK